MKWKYCHKGTLLILHVSGPMSTQLVVSTALARAGPIEAITAFMLWNVPGLIAYYGFGQKLDKGNHPVFDFGVGERIDQWR
eukprot:scaffold167639_cov48-Cyclotella_meneghiniana.AAC.1